MKFSLRSIIELFTPFLVLGILCLYVFAFIVKAPYTGFYFNSTNWEIKDVFTPPTQLPAIQIGDRILRIGDHSRQDFQNDARLPLFPNGKPGDTVLLTIQRGDRIMIIPHRLPGLNYYEIINRLVPIWFPFIFWGIGTVTLFLLRPKDIRWALLVAFNYLTALWLMAGFVSYTHVYYSALVMRCTFWLSFPVYLHLQWVYPQPLKQLKRQWIWGLYGIGFLLAGLQAFQKLPGNLYTQGFAIVLAINVLIVGVHIRSQPKYRKELQLLGIFTLIAFLPIMGLAISPFFQNSPLVYTFALLGLVAVPVGYLYLIFRRQLGGLELRANRIISLFFYALLLLALALPLVTLFHERFAHPGASFVLTIVLVLLTSLVTAIAYPGIRHLLDRYVFRMPAPPANFLEVYSSRILTSLDVSDLAQVLQDEILPAMMISQAALLRFPDFAADPAVTQPGMEPVFCLNVSYAQLPSAEQIQEILAQNEARPLPNDFPETPHQGPGAWVHLALSLRFKERLIGVCLFGHRDPDDYYAATEIITLQSLMNQTALALINIDQARRLRTLYQANIDRQETEKKILAEELHDDVLHYMAMLQMSLDSEHLTPQFNQAYQTVVRHIREIVSGLRPGLLYYGLYSALEELVDEAPDQLASSIPILLEVAPSEHRYDQDSEMHIFRIVQQACQNAVKHAHASQIVIRGDLGQDSLELCIADDGVGFQTETNLNLANLLVNQHYGLAGMYERSALIGARLQISSRPNHGTQVQIHWKPENALGSQ